MMCKDKKGLRDKDYYDSKSIIHQFCDQFDMLEWMNENYNVPISTGEWRIYLHISILYLFAYKNACSNNQTMLWSFELSFYYS